MPNPICRKLSQTAAPENPAFPGVHKAMTPEQYEAELPAVGTLSRTKSLLLAALRVWELKHRISE